MTIYGIFSKVAQALSNNSTDQLEILNYLKETMDDDFEFTRSRYCKQAPIPDRDLGPIRYIICGTVKPFNIRQIKEQEGFDAEIIWNKSHENFEEDKELLINSGYEHLIIITCSK